MKAKWLITITIVVLVAITVILVITPLISQENIRSTMRSAPMETGSFFTYTFSVDRNNYSSSSSRSYFAPSGVIKFTMETGGIVSVKEIVFNTMKTESYYVNNSYGVNSSFVRYFFNQILMQPGTFTSIPGNLTGEAVKDNFNYHISYSGGNSTIAALAINIGVTSPLEVNLINVNTQGISSANFLLSVDPNQFDYDHAGGYNVLVRSFITGNVSFLRGIFNNPDLSYSVFFDLFLVATNVALEPLDYAHYLFMYTGYIPIMWIIAIPTLYFTVRNAIKRSDKMLRNKPRRRNK